MTPVGIKSGMTVAVIVVVVIGLFTVDQFLAKVESSEIKKTAQQSYSEGSSLLAEGKPAQALDFLRDAHASERQNLQYELSLITGLTEAGKTAEAEPLLTDILQREPNDGQANLAAARLMIRKGDTEAAEAYYHRAIYGEWAGNPIEHRVATRMELIDLMVQKKQTQELLAELISLEAEAPPSAEIQNRLGQLFLFAGAPARAAMVYEALAEKNPKDIAAYEGLGEAELEQGQYRAAHEAFLRAFLREPNNASVRAHLQTLNTVTSLDPTLRQLTSAEKYSRSVRILDMTRAALEQCTARKPAGSTAVAGTAEQEQLLTTAEGMIAAKVPAHVTNELAEGVLSVAEKLWHLYITACGASLPGAITPGETNTEQNALNLIMRKLAS